MARSIFIGVAWPYANGPLHVGHLAGAYLPADVVARFHRLKGNRVLMVSGSDCHGTPITLHAESEGLAPEHLIRRYHQSFLNTFSKLQISFDWFTQTYAANHYEVVRRFFVRLLERGHLSRQVLRAPFSESLNRFLPDRYIQGTCPNCGFDSARGDQCDQCGHIHDPQELLNPTSKLDGEPIDFRETEHYVFTLSRLEAALREWLIHLDRAAWRPNTLNFTDNWLDQGLADRAITRDIEWGVPIPVSGAEFEQKRLYVWFETVIGYLSASIEWAGSTAAPDQWRDWWDRDDPGVCSSYFIGKDNIPFHTIIWPALLIGHGDLRLPDGVPANEFLNLEGRKMSTSQGWALTLPDVESRYQPDQLRYYLLANSPETRDANWSWDDFIRRNNNELVGVWGNLANRTLGIAWRRYGEVPEPADLYPADRELLHAVEDAFPQVGLLIDAKKIRTALQEAFALAHKANAYLAHEEPWKLLESDPRRASTVIHTALQVVHNLGTLLSPFLPESSDYLRQLLGHSEMLAGSVTVRPVDDAFGKRDVIAGQFATGERWIPSWLPTGRKLKEPSALFRKLDDSIADEERTRLNIRLNG